MAYQARWCLNIPGWWHVGDSGHGDGSGGDSDGDSGGGDSGDCGGGGSGDGVGGR